MKTDIYTAIARRMKLIKATRHAWLMWGEASEIHQEAVTALVPCRECIDRAVRRCRHTERRYSALERRLSDATGLSRTSVYNGVAKRWPICPELTTTNL